MEKVIQPKEILDFINDYELEGDYRQITIKSARSIFQADENSIVWLKPNVKNADQVVTDTAAKLIICKKGHAISAPSKCLVRVDDPRVMFIKVMKQFFYTRKVEWGIHPTAIIHPEAKLAKNIFIGPFSVIGRAEIEENTIIHGSSVINDNVFIGKNVIIHEHTVVGSEGFHFAKNDNGQLEQFPHVGRVVIEDDVELFPFVNVDKGALYETRIKKGAKIDHYCHISHNTLVGEYTQITAGSILCGGSQVGDWCWIGIGSIIKEKAVVGNHVFLGLGTVVTKDIPDGETWIGSPARPIETFVKMQNALKNLT